MTRTYRIALIPGDGIGKEVIPEGVGALEAAAEAEGFSFQWTEFDWSCETWKTTGRMMPEDGIDQLRGFDAIYLGAVGYPGVPDHLSLWGLLIPIRRAFDQYVNLRPCRVMDGLPSPIVDAHSRGIDFWVVRENVEGEYSQVGGRMFEGEEREMAVQETVFTRKGVDRILEYAFTLAEEKGLEKVTSATKSNGLFVTMPYWDERFALASERHPKIKADQYHVDILAAHFVQRPERFQVVVASNLFGDILSDLGPGVCGSIGIAPSANLNPERTHPSMFEPVHGSAPDIAGKGIANPIGAIWAGAMMLEHLGEKTAHDRILKAIETVVRDGAVKTPDFGGAARTRDLGDAIKAAV